jgi:uncharacterized membrane protein
LGDRLITRGTVTGRVIVAATGYVAASALLVPGIFSALLFVALPFYATAAFALSMSNPPLDAARLDVVHHSMWGRAEGVRQVLRTAGQAGAPVLFGLVSDRLAGGGAKGLEYTFLIMLVTLVGAGLLLVRARHTYPGDVAGAIRSEARARAA